MANLNVATLGRSGAGKSSLLNYLIGKEQFKSASGRPVTKEMFTAECTRIADVPVTVYDTRGIEAGDDYDKWKEKFEDELNKHDISHPIKDWFHVVIYCIDVNGSRVEPIDQLMINRFYCEGTKVIVVFTHADRVGKKRYCEMEEALLSACKNLSKSDIIAVDSVNHKKEYFGQDLKRMIVEQFFDNIFLRLPDHCIAMIHENICTFHKHTKLKIHDYKYNFLNPFCFKNAFQWLENTCRQYILELQDKIIPQLVRATLDESFDTAVSLGKILDSNGRCTGFRCKLDISLSSTTQIYSVSHIISYAIAALTISPPIFPVRHIVARLILKERLDMALSEFCHKAGDEIYTLQNGLVQYFTNVKDQILKDTKSS